jgi:hypothetical protein
MVPFSGGGGGAPRLPHSALSPTVTGRASSGGGFSPRSSPRAPPRSSPLAAGAGGASREAPFVVGLASFGAGRQQQQQRRLPHSALSPTVTGRGGGTPAGSPRADGGEGASEAPFIVSLGPFGERAQRGGGAAAVSTAAAALARFAPMPLEHILLRSGLPRAAEAPASDGAAAGAAAPAAATAPPPPPPPPPPPAAPDGTPETASAAQAVAAAVVAAAAAHERHAAAFAAAALPPPPRSTEGIPRPQQPPAVGAAAEGAAPAGEGGGGGDGGAAAAPPPPVAPAAATEAPKEAPAALCRAAVASRDVTALRDAVRAVDAAPPPAAVEDAALFDEARALLEVLETERRAAKALKRAARDRDAEAIKEALAAADAAGGGAAAGEAYAEAAAVAEELAAERRALKQLKRALRQAEGGGGLEALAAALVEAKRLALTEAELYTEGKAALKALKAAATDLTLP